MVGRGKSFSVLSRANSHLQMELVLASKQKIRELQSSWECLPESLPSW